MLISMFLKKFSQFILDLIYPPQCVNCKKANRWLCQDCLNKITPIVDAFCRRCGTPTSINEPHLCLRCQSKPLSAIDGIRAAAHFEKTPIRQAIHSLKYRNHQALTAPLAKLLAEAYNRFHLKADVILPVPLHKLRHRDRGYNQSELLARELANELHLPVNTHLLQRIRPTKVQVDLSAIERYHNVANAFSCDSQSLAGQKVLLIDDVCTTGATLDACAAALKTAGAQTVWGLTLARASVIPLDGKSDSISDKPKS